MKTNMNYNLYENYLLEDTSTYELSSHTMHMLDACIWLVDNRSSIRQTADNFMVSKSALHRYIHHQLRHVSYELYVCVVNQLHYNKEKSYENI